MTNITFKYYYE